MFSCREEDGREASPPRRPRLTRRSPCLITPPPHCGRLDQAYTLSDEGFRAAVVVDDTGAEPPACFPEKYGDELERSLMEQVSERPVHQVWAVALDGWVD